MGEGSDQKDEREARLRAAEGASPFARYFRLAGKALERTIHNMSRGGSAVAGLLLFLLVFYITADVSGRYFFRAPLRGTLEVSQIMLLIVIFFFIAYTQAAKGHVSVELFCSRWSPRWQAFLGVLYSVAAVVFFTLMINYEIGAALADLRNGVTTDQLKIPIFAVKSAIPVGAFLMVLELLVDITRYVQQFAKRGSA